MCELCDEELNEGWSSQLYIRNFCNCKKKAWKKIQASTEFKPLTSEISVMIGVS